MVASAQEKEMKRQWRLRTSLLLLVVALTLSAAGPVCAAVTKELDPGRAIATWPSGVPGGETRPVVVFLPGWEGCYAVDASVSAQNANLVDQGYVTLAVGFDYTGVPPVAPPDDCDWSSNIAEKTKRGLDLLCADAAIPANCNAIVLNGESYGGSQNYWVIEYLRSNGYAGVGGTGTALGFISEDAGYAAPGTVTDGDTGAFTQTGWADTASYAVAMIQNLGDTTFPVDECTWGNCGARTLGDHHLASGDTNVFSICPLGGEHGTRGFAPWDAWVISAVKTMIHTTSAVPTFTGYTPPALTVGNACVHANVAPGLSVSGIEIVANGQPVHLHGVNMVDPFVARNNTDWYPNSDYSVANYATLARDWHAKIVRVSIYPTQWKNMDRATLLAGLAQEVNAALGNGMYVIVSYHVIGWPEGWNAAAWPGNPVDTYDSHMSVATSFWTQMALIYGADKRILFDLWNEPAHGVVDVGPDDCDGRCSSPSTRASSRRCETRARRTSCLPPATAGQAGWWASRMTRWRTRMSSTPITSILSRGRTPPPRGMRTWAAWSGSSRFWSASGGTPTPTRPSTTDSGRARPRATASPSRSGWTATTSAIWPGRIITTILPPCSRKTGA
jgi:hypothetical protein